MEERIKKLISGIIAIAFFIFGVFYLFFPTKSLEDIWSYIGYAISLDSVLIVCYSMFLWRLNPLEKMPSVDYSEGQKRAAHRVLIELVNKIH